MEFPYAAIPRPVWERIAAHLKEMGVDTCQSSGAEKGLRTPRNSTMLSALCAASLSNANLESPIPDRLLPLAKSHGGPLTDTARRRRPISAIMPRALDNERQLLISGTPAIRWTDVFETLGLDEPKPAWHAGAIALSGAGSPAASH